jgi:hypothetical protein
MIDGELWWLWYSICRRNSTISWAACSRVILAMGDSSGSTDMRRCDAPQEKISIVGAPVEVAHRNIDPLMGACYTFD